MSCGVTTLQIPRAHEPGTISSGFGISAGGIGLHEDEGPRLLLCDFGPYVRIGLFRNCEVGVMVSPFTLIGITSGSAHLKYQFMSKPYGSLILGGGYQEVFSIDISQGGVGFSTLNGTVLFGDRVFYGMKFVYIHENETGSFARDQNVYAGGLVFGGSTSGDLKAIIEINGLIAFSKMESWRYGGFGSTIGLGIQYDF